MNSGRLKSFIQRLSKADFVFYLLPLLMALLVAGTLAQRWLGLYEAHHRFFGAFILWIGSLPLPGGYTLTGILALSLLFKFIFYSEWRWRRAGIILTHLGVLILLFGGLLTALTAREGFMVLPEGTESPYVYDYNQRSLFVFKDDVLQHSFNFEDLNGSLKGMPFEVEILFKCGNCKIIKTEKPQENAQSMARFMDLKAIPSEREPEKNFSAAKLKINGNVYVVFEGMPKPIEIPAGDSVYKIIFGKQQRLLPFSVHLKDFAKIPYPGTNQARAYYSDVVVKDGSLEWPARIEMNKPLRYKGYTFYQSSFEQGEGMEASILAVVENRGQVFPYLGALVIAAGLLLHAFLAARRQDV